MSTSLTRRTALASLPALGTVGAVGAHASPAPASPPSDPAGAGEIRLAFLADTHADPENDENMARMGAVLEAIEEFDPELVLHGGDVTEHGSPAEYEAFESAIPDALKDRVASVPGNHETRWDPTAGGRRREHLGEEVQVHDVAGVRIILADTTTHHQEVAWWSPSALAALGEAMSGSRKLPRILVTHFPMGDGFYYVANQQDFEDVLARHPVTLHLTGHTHRELLTRVNRRDQLEGAAVKIDGAYYELTGSVDALDVTRVEIPDPANPGERVRTHVTTYDLRPDRGRDTMIPRRAEPEVDGSSVAIDVRLPRAFAGSVEAAFYDTSVYAGRNEELEWTPLTDSRGRFSGALDAAELAPGRQRLHLRIVPDDDSGPRLLTVPFSLGDDGSVWENEVDGMIRSGPAIVRHGDEALLVVGTSAGQVVGIDGSGDTVWTHDVEGEVLHDLAAVDGGRAVAVPDASGYLHLLAADGTPLWRYATGAATAADPGVGLLWDTEALLLCAGSTLHAVEAATGTALWTTELPAPSMGAPASDGQRVLLGAGDGCAHAVDARDGTLLWSTSVTDKEGTYQRFIYGPWNDAVAVLPDGGVLVAGIADAWCLDPEDGSERWRVDGSFQSARDAVTEEGHLVMADEGGEIVRIDPAGGEELARHATAERVFDAGFVLVGDVVHAASHSGLITAVDLASGEVEQVTRVAAAPVVAPGAAFGELVVFADLAGTVRAVEPF